MDKAPKSTETQPDELKAVSEYAWKWFSYHATQRMTVFRFFFIVIGVVAVGYYQTISKAPLLAFAFSLLGIALSLLFWRLDLRTRELIKIGEAALIEMERQFEHWDGNNFKLVSLANSKATEHTTRWFPKYLYSYGQIFTSIFSIILLASIIGFSYAANELYHLKNNSDHIGSRSTIGADISNRRMAR